MIVPVVGAAPAGAAKFAGYPCRGELHSPPRHPAGMNDCTRGWGGPCGGSEVCRIHVGAYRIRPPRHPAGMNDCPRVGAHITKRPCRCCMVILHTVKRPCRCCIVILHTVPAPRRCCTLISHTATGHAMGRMLLRPYPGTRHSCTRPNSQASADAPAKFAGVRRRPGQIRRCP